MSRFMICCKECGHDDFYLREIDDDNFVLCCKECGVNITSQELNCGIMKLPE